MLNGNEMNIIFPEQGSFNYPACEMINDKHNQPMAECGGWRRSCKINTQTFKGRKDGGISSNRAAVPAVEDLSHWRIKQ